MMDPNKRAISICRFAACAMLCLVAQSSGLQAQDSATKQAADGDSSILAWFDGLGFYDYSNLPLVKVTTGWWTWAADDSPENSTIYAFVIDETKQSCRVFTLDLTEIPFKFTPPETPAHEVVKIERVSLAETAKTLLRESIEQTVKKDVHSWRKFGKLLNDASELMVFARACAAHNELDLSHQLLEAARDTFRRSRDPKVAGASFHEALSDDLARMSVWRIILDFGEPEIPRTELLARLEQSRKNFPTSPYYERATETTELLQQMVIEDRDHKTPADFDSLTIDEKVAELIFRLRDQQGQKFESSGGCDIFLGDLLASWVKKSAGDAADTKPLAGSPAQQLFDIGLDAVPQLIEALEDPRLTRAVDYDRNFYYSPHVLRVGNCAQRILCRIANRSFDRATFSNAGNLKDDQPSALKMQVESWWREITKKGEEQVLIEGTIAGDTDSPRQAHRLRDKYPLAALEAISQGTRNASSDWVRDRLIELAGSLGEPAGEFLKDEMTRAPALSNRVTAASQLVKLESKVAIEAMIGEWKNISNHADKVTSKWGKLDNGVSELIQFLASCNSLDAIQALHNSYHVHLIRTRFEIAKTFGRHENMFKPGAVNADGLWVSNDPIPKDDSVEEEIESILVTALSDTNRRKGIGRSRGVFSFIDPRICDIAGSVLADRSPQKYTFDPKATPDIAETQRIQAINAWRKLNNIELLPEFQPRKIVRLPAEETSPKLAAVLTDTDEQGRAMASDAVLKLGLGALPAVIELIESAPDAAAIPDLRELARKLSTTVALITISESSAPVTVSLRSQLETLEERPLTEDQLVDLLLSVANDLPKGATGIQISAQRSSVASGVELTIGLTTEWQPKNGKERMWSTGYFCSINGKNAGGSGGQVSLEHATDREAYSGFSKTVNTVLRSAYDQPFEIQVSMIRDE